MFGAYEGYITKAGMDTIAYNKDCPFCYHGMIYEHSEKVEGLCDCITGQFKEK